MPQNPDNLLFHLDGKFIHKDQLWGTICSAMFTINSDGRYVPVSVESETLAALMMVRFHMTEGDAEKALYWLIELGYIRLEKIGQTAHFTPVSAAEV